MVLSLVWLCRLMTLFCVFNSSTGPKIYLHKVITNVSPEVNNLCVCVCVHVGVCLGACEHVCIGAHTLETSEDISPCFNVLLMWP